MVLTMIDASQHLHRPWVYPPSNAAAFRAYLKRIAPASHAGFLALRRVDHALVGVVNLNEIIRGAMSSAFLGYYASAVCAGQGLMAEGLALVIDHAFGPLHLHRLEANIQPANERSIALVRRCGFQQEGFSRRYLKIGGRWRDHERWAMWAERWRELRRTGMIAF